MLSMIPLGFSILFFSFALTMFLMTMVEYKFVACNGNWVYSPSLSVENKRWAFTTEDNKDIVIFINQDNSYRYSFSMNKGVSFYPLLGNSKSVAKALYKGLKAAEQDFKS